MVCLTVTDAGFKLIATLLLLSPESWDYRNALPQLILNTLLLTRTSVLKIRFLNLFISQETKNKHCLVIGEMGREQRTVG